MRLTNQEIQAIISSIHGFDGTADIYLFGSRVDDLEKGGDIDLLVISDHLTLTDKISILMSIKDQIGEQRIDLSLKTKKDLREDPFVQSVLPHVIKLI